MKAILLFLTLATSSSVFACIQEAQFIGKVTGHRQIENNECVFKVDSFSWFGPSYVCPLGPGEVSGHEFSDKECVLKDGESVSGVFVKTNDQIVIY